MTDIPTFDLDEIFPPSPATTPEQRAKAASDAETLRLAAEVLTLDPTVLDHEHHATPIVAVLRAAIEDAEQIGADYRTVQLARAILGEEL